MDFRVGSFLAIVGFVCLVGCSQSTLAPTPTVTSVNTVVPMGDPIVAVIVNDDSASATPTSEPIPTETATPAPPTQTPIPVATVAEAPSSTIEPTATVVPTAEAVLPSLTATNVPTATPMPVIAPGLENLDGFLWANRLIVVFVECHSSDVCDSAETSTIETQFWNENAAVIDRHILWFIVANDSVATNYTGNLSNTFANNLRQRYAQLGQPLEVVLIGKDGGVKNRQPWLDSSAIYWQIDQMPMRQAEMEQQTP